jgi:hypothetical protein
MNMAAFWYDAPYFLVERYTDRRFVIIIIIALMM